MIRITTQALSTHTVVTIDGWAEDLDLKEIQRVRRALKGKVLLNLRGLDGCVPEGIRILQDWVDAGGQLEATTPYLDMMLKAAKPKRPAH